MNIELSDIASNAMLDVLSQLMDGGRIELMDSGRLLAVLMLSNPATKEALGGELEFNQIYMNDATGQGIATVGRVVASNGAEIFTCDVGDENSDAVIKLNTTKIFRNGPVKLSSFRLMMP